MSQTQSSNTGNMANDPIAICGMAIRLPGGITTPAEFWKFLIEGRDARGKIPASRYNSDAFHPGISSSGDDLEGAGYFLDPAVTDLDSFDQNAFPSLSRSEIAAMDPAQRQLLEIVRECLESAGEASWEGKDIGCYVGSFGQDWQDFDAQDLQSFGVYRVTGASDFMAANRISYEYGLCGPSLTIRTACSSSLVALHSACQAVKLGDCSAAIVAGANMILSPSTTAGLAEVGALSPDVSCRSFDASANGYARGEAVNAIFIKRVSDALRDGNPIRAIIRGTASNADGRSSGLTNPNSDAHEALIRKAYRDAGLDPAETPFAELHATGTPAGDPAEAKAVARVFGKTGLYMGAVKPNVGHGEGASGLTSLIKAVLALEHQIIPPNIKFHTPNPNIPFQEMNLTVPVVSTPWPQGRRKRVSVNSFGLGGSNAHVILDSALSLPACPENSAPDSVDEPSEEPRPRLLLCSGNTETSAKDMSRRIQDYVKTSGPQLNMDNLAYTLGCRRKHGSHRSFMIADGNTLETSIKPILANNPALIFVFTGQGAQYPEMGRVLAEQFPSFDKDLEEFDRILASTAAPPDWSIRDLLRQPIGPAAMGGVTSQPLCIAVQIGLVRLLRTWGVTASAVVGHSSGEIAAAYACGAISMSDAIQLSYCRGRSLGSQHRPGAMAVVGLGRKTVLPYLREGVVVGCDNSPVNVTLSGDDEALQATMACIQRDHPDGFFRKLPVDMAYHSHHMETISHEYIEAITHLDLSGKPKIPMYSTTYGRLLEDGDALDSNYWRTNLVQPVLFNDAIRSILLNHENTAERNIFVELGPHSALSGTLRQCFKEHWRGASDKLEYVATLVRNQPADLSLLRTIGNLHCHGVPINLDQVFVKGKVLTDLPQYSWDQQKVETSHRRLADTWRHRKFPRHELLGVPTLESSPLEPTWRNVLRLRDVAWVADHRVGNQIVFPGAGYIAMAGEAVRQHAANEQDKATGVAGYDVRDVRIDTAMAITESAPVEVITSLRPSRMFGKDTSSWYDFSISTIQGGHSSTLHCWGQVRAAPSSRRLMDEAPSKIYETDYGRKLSADKWYRSLRRNELAYGPAFASLDSMSASVRSPTATGSVRRDVIPVQKGDDYACHPIVLDAVFQLLIMAQLRGRPSEMTGAFVPTYLREMSIRLPEVRSPATGAYNIIGAVQTESDAGSTKVHGSATVSWTSPSGVREIVASGNGMEMTKLNDSKSSGDSTDETAGLTNATLVWKPCLSFLGAGSARLFRSTQDLTAAQRCIEVAALLSVRHVSEALRAAKGSNWFLEKYRQSLLAADSRIRTAHHPIWLDLHGEVLARASSGELVQHLQTLRHETLESDPSNGEYCLGAFDAVAAVGQQLPSIITGKTTALEVLTDGGLLGRFYNLMNVFDYGPFFDHLAHERPQCKILEVGAGTGSTTARILPHLYSRAGNRLFSQYCFTDISEGFLSQAKARFSKHKGMEYILYDVSKTDEIQQGIQAGEYDIIIASNVIHATKSLQESLENVRKLLKPDGYLVLVELCSESAYVSFVFGGLEGWWLGAEDGREERPYVTSDRWVSELRRAGFTGVEIITDHENTSSANASCNSVIVARPWVDLQTPESRIGTSTPDSGIGTLTPRDLEPVTVLTPTPLSSTSQGLLKQSFAAEGFDARVCQVNVLDQLPPITDRYVVSMLDMDSPWLLSEVTDEPSFRKMVDLIESIKANGCRMIWLTRPSQVPHLTRDPKYAPILGLARTTRFEAGVDFATLETDSAFDCAQTLTTLARFIGTYRQRGEDGEDDRAVDYEYALVDGAIHVGRYDWLPLVKTCSGNMQDGAMPKERELSIARKGMLQTLEWQPSVAQSPSGDQVQVEIAAVGLNFKDLMLALGVISKGDLGFEAVGTVVSVGPEVKRLAVGNRVAILGSGGFRSSFTVTEDQCERLPESLAFEDAATMYAVFCTVMLAFKAGRLCKGQSALIHSGCGGIGLAAIQLCQSLDVEVFTTVGSEHKRKYLQEVCGIPSDHIFDSRSESFRDGVLSATGGRGVDLVLNSLAGDLLQASWDLVADFGTMIELGQRDIQNNNKLSMSNFSRNRGYYAIDYDHFVRDQPANNHEIMSSVSKLYEQGKIKPLPIYQTFQASQVEQCFRTLQKGEHIGKIVVEMTRTTADTSAATNLEITQRYPDRSSFDPNASYLLVGGLGGIGKSVALWMAENGAKSLMFMSRSAPHSNSTGEEMSAKHRDFFKELSLLGCSVTVHRGDVTVLGDVFNILEGVRQPIKGVIQLAMELNDDTLSSMTFSKWKASFSPKAVGTMNLHRAFQERFSEVKGAALDFFVIFSSHNGLHGWYGQSNYAAGNTFQDAFVNFRRGQGLPASVVNLGPVDDVGFVHDNPAIAARVKATFKYFLPEKQLLMAVEAAIALSHPGTSPLDAQDGVCSSGHIIPGLQPALPAASDGHDYPWRGDMRFSSYQNIHRDSCMGNEGALSIEDMNEGGKYAKQLHQLLISITQTPSMLNDESHGTRTVISTTSTVGIIICGAILEKICAFVDILGAQRDELLRDPEKMGNVSFRDVGLDSLVAIELRNWLRQTFKLDITVLEILAGGTVGNVAMEQRGVLWTVQGKVKKNMTV